MNSLGKYCHDFPRLAKESGYNFQLYRGKINWSDIEKVNIEEITSERNFQLLEENLIHVINCNLEKDYDVKILDQNFVKLFKLAQLGIDYLSYCELYLDRCVVLLQEQLSSYQEECSHLKAEIEKKDKEIRRSKKKIKMQYRNFKCKKCEKIFVNEAYLESHEKRRHGRNGAEEIEVKKPIYAEKVQQTDIEKKTVSVFIQTTDSTPITVIDESSAKDIPSQELIKNDEQELKIESFKRDLEELKIRLSLAERSMEEKKNDERGFQNNFHSAVIPVIHSYIATPSTGFAQINPTASALVSGLPNTFVVHESVKEKIEPFKTETFKLEEIQVNRISNGQSFREDSPEKPSSTKSNTPERVGQNLTGKNQSQNHFPINNSVRDQIDSCVKVNNPSTHPTYESEDDGTVKAAKSTKSPKVEKVANLSHKHFDVLRIDSSPARSLSDSPYELEPALQYMSQRTSTPTEHVSSPKTNEGKTANNWSIVTDEESGMTIGSLKQEIQRQSSVEIPVRDESPTQQEKSNSLLRKIITKKPAKIQELKFHLKNSFTHMYGSVGKKTPHIQAKNVLVNAKSDIVHDLHNRLKNLGIDPEWSGIPKETIKQKLKILEHNRSLLNKENKLYPFIRKKIEKHVLKRLKTHSLASNDIARENLESVETLDSPKSKVINPMKNIPGEITIYDTDGDSNLEDFMLPYSTNPTHASSPKGIIDKSENAGANLSGTEKLSTILQKEDKHLDEKTLTDFSIFQVCKSKDSKPKVIGLDSEKTKLPIAADELQTNSDFDDELFKEFEEHSSKMIAKDVEQSPMRDTIASFPEKPEDDFAVGTFSINSEKLDGPNILKCEADTDKYQLTFKKKVLFAEQPEIFESTSKPVSYASKSVIEKQKIYDMTSVVDDDDDWSIESEWTVDNVTTTLKFSS